MQRGAVTASFQGADPVDGAPLRLARLLPRSASDVSSHTFVAFNSKDVLLFDPRASAGAVQRRAYKINCEFSCGATTENGKLAMGSANGALRLYAQPCRAHATLSFQINCGADPILGIDVSPDEQWLLATCPYYLSVLNVWARAFDAPTGRDLPALTRLAISPEHQQRVARYFAGAMPPFTTAKFEVKRGRVVAIVAAIGTALVAWDFRRIESQNLPTYSIKLVGGEAIVDEQPLAGTNDVAFISENQVCVIERFSRGRR
jgi:hypothetical protein